MATKQSLKGGTNKIYEIVNTFNKGYNTSVADDQLNERIFRDLTNFMPSKEGNVTKRPGINRLKAYELFDNLKTFTADNFILTVQGNSNEPNSTQYTTVDYLFNNFFKLANFTYTRSETIESASREVTALFTPKSLANFTILEDEGNILEKLKDFRDIINFEKADSFYKNNYYVNFLAILYGDYEETYVKNDSTKTLLKTNAIRIIKVSVNLSYDESYKMDINYEVRQPYRSSKSNRLTFRYTNDETIDLAVYANHYYFMNGYDALLKISRDISGTYSSSSIEEIYNTSSALYRPTAIEVSNVGFNILSSNPLSYYDVQGTADAIKGVFYTYQNEPVQTIPYNKTFKIHILASGSGTISNPKYRPDNGEIDEEINPYKTMQGSFNTGNTVFTCTGIDSTTNIEIKITKGGTDFITYAKLGSVEINEVHTIASISPLVLASKYCKVINNQLVLFGGHGYLFFSDYDNFYYFPNYNNIYAAETENEQIVGISYFRQYHAVFTNKRIKRMSGTFGADDFGLYPLNDYIGCSNPKTIRQIENYIYFLSYNGIYRLKQGYLGEGTENVDQIDLPIYKSYNADSMIRSYNIQNYYALYSKSEALLYNFTNDAFYKFRTSDVSADVVGDLNVDETIYSIPFQYNKLQDYLLYGIKVKDSNDNITFDMCYQNFSEEETDRTDNGLTFVSTFETISMSLGTPTNTKKFKEIYLKMYNRYGKNIPLYVTIKVDDHIIVSPTNYVMKFDEDTITYYYAEDTASNKTLEDNILGSLELGIDPLGDRTQQILKMRVGAKGKSIKIIISDGILQGEDGYSPNQNPYRFDLATIGIVYKLKKVREG